MKKLSILYLIALLVGLGAGPLVAQTEDPDELTPRTSPLTALDTPITMPPCLPLGVAKDVHVVNYESTSRVYFKVEGDLNAVTPLGTARVREVGSAQILQPGVSSTEGYAQITLDPNKSYELLGRNECGQWTVIQQLNTAPLPANSLIEVSEALGDALSQWKMDENATNLYDFLLAQPNVTAVERTEFLQNFVKEGAPLPNSTLTNGFTITDFEPDGPGPGGPGGGGPGGGGGDGEEECTCRVIKINMVSEVFPTSSSQVDPQINPAILPNQIIRETNRIKFWHTGSFEGPARYQQIWGETKRCRNVTESNRWGDNATGPLVNALGRAAFRIEQVCKEGNWTNGRCYCAQNVSFRCRYDAQLDARANTRGGACFNPPGKKSQAIVDDAAMLLIARRPDPASGASAEEVASVATAHGAAASCNKDFQEQRYLDILKLGLAAYAYIKGLPIDIKDPTVSQVGNAIWDQYQKSLFIKSLESLLTKPWVVGNCDQTIGAQHGLDYSTDLVLNGKEALVFVLTAASYLEVNGMTAWDANARVLSGFGMALSLEKNEFVGQENEYCCTKPAGIYQTSTFHPLHGSSTYNQVIGSLLATDLDCCFPVSPVNGQIIINDERNVLIGNPILACETSINGREGAPATAQQPSISVQGDRVVLHGFQQEQPFNAEFFSTDGKLLFRCVVNNGDNAVLNPQHAGLASGIYFLRLNSPGQSFTQKIFLP